MGNATIIIADAVRFAMVKIKVAIRDSMVANDNFKVSYATTRHFKMDVTYVIEDFNHVWEAIGCIEFQVVVTDSYK